MKGMKKLIIGLIALSSLPALAESLCISHKGSFKLAPENSLQSLNAALELGADGVEFDVHHTREGRPILMHDKNLNIAVSLPGKRCDKKTPVNQLSLSDIRENCGLAHMGGIVKIPLLEEALEMVSVSGKMVFIELKDRPSPYTRRVIADHYRNQPENFRLIAFDTPNMDYLKADENEPGFWEQVQGLDLNLMPFRLNPRYGVNIMNRFYRLRPASYYRRRGIETGVWTVVKDKRIKKFLKMGVKFVTTDDVEKCLRFKEEIQF